jgi:hypothetical protein
MQNDRRISRFRIRRAGAVLVVLGVMAGPVSRPSAQGLGGAGTIEGIVKDPSDAVVVGATVLIVNPVTDFTRTAQTDGRGHFVFRNLPPNPYHLVATAPGFQTFEQDIDVRSSVPIALVIAVKIAAASETVSVSGHSTSSKATRRRTPIWTSSNWRGCPFRPTPPAPSEVFAGNVASTG